MNIRKPPFLLTVIAVFIFLDEITVNGKVLSAEDKVVIR